MFQKFQNPTKKDVRIIVDCSDCQKAILGYFQYFKNQLDDIRESLTEYKLNIVTQLNKNLNDYRVQTNERLTELNKRLNNMDKKINYLKNRLGI